MNGVIYTINSDKKTMLEEIFEFKLGQNTTKVFHPTPHKSDQPAFRVRGTIRFDLEKGQAVLTLEASQ